MFLSLYLILATVKIAINTRFLLPDHLEGIGRYTDHIVQRLVRDCKDDEFYFLFDRTYDAKYLYAQNVTPIVVSPPARHPLLWYWWFEKSLPRIFDKHNIDLFISLDGYCSLKSSIPTIMCIHDLAYLHFPDQIKWSARIFYRHFVPKFCKRADQLLTISEATQADIEEHFQIPKSKIGIVPNGFNPKLSPLDPEEILAAKKEFSAGQEYFCCLGAIHPRKNITGTIKAFDQYKSQTGSSEKLLIVGRMAWKTSEIKSVFENSSHKKDIHFLGYLPDEKVRLVLGASKALLFLSYFEGFGVPLLEAMKLKVPSIYSNLSVMPEVAGKTGIPVNPEDPDTVVKAMIDLEHWDKNQMEMEIAKKMKQYSWEQSVESLKSYINLFRKSSS